MPAQPTKSRKPSNKYAPTAWGGEALFDLEVPSGQLCQVRRPGVAGLVKMGVLDSLDALSGIISNETLDRVEKGKDPKATAAEVKALANSKDGLLRALDLSDKVVLGTVVQPPILPIPLVRDPISGEVVLGDDGRPLEIPIDGRDPGIYVDQVDLFDKMFILQFVVGGSSDLEQFRQGLGETMGGLADGPEDEVPAE